jgi:ubiquinone/menaquinone biosynthesis C-methylase UbiE
MGRNRYLLRSRDREELDRLEHQHRVWKEVTDRVLDRAGFKKGGRLLDLGSGPGYLSLDLAARVGESGSVLAVDSSEEFIAHLRHEAESRRLPQLRGRVADARELELDEGSLDGAICRWLLMFVAQPEEVIARVARGLRPGGVFAVMEYAQFRSVSLWPRGESFRKLYDAVHRLISRAGGDADIGARVPGLLIEAGFEIKEILPAWRVGRPGEPLWEWMEATSRNHSNLVNVVLLSGDELAAYYREWGEHSELPGAFFTAPPLLATIAKKL